MLAKLIIYVVTVPSVGKKADCMYPKPILLGAKRSMFYYAFSFSDKNDDRNGE